MGGFGSFFGQKLDFWPKIDHFELPIPVFWPKNGHFFDFFDQKVVGNFLGEFWGGFGVILGSKNGIFGPKNGHFFDFLNKKVVRNLLGGFWGGLGLILGHFRPRIGHFKLPIPVYGPKNDHFFDFFNKIVVGNLFGEFWGVGFILD